MYGSFHVKSQHKKVDPLRFCSNFSMSKYMLCDGDIPIFSSKY